MLFMDWTNLPQNLIQQFVGFLRCPEVSSLCLVCKHWKFVVRLNIHHLRPAQPYPDLLDLFPNLQHLDLSGCWDGLDDAKIQEWVKKLAPLKIIKSINLSKCHSLTNAAIAEISQSLLNLETLILNGCREPFPVPVGSMGYCGVDGDTLGGLLKLRHLNLRWNPVSDSSILTLATLTSLTQLVLGECPGVTDRGVETLVRLTGMEILNLDRTMISSKGLLKISSLNFIRELSLANCSCVDNESLMVLTSLISLESLNLSKCNVSDAGIEALCVLPRLQELDISFCLRIFGRCFEGFGASGVLCQLKLQDCYGCCSEDNLKTLIGIKSLRHVDLKNCSNLADNGIGYLSCIPLTDLNLSKCCQVSKTGFKTLANIAGLAALDISFWLNIEDDWLKSLTQLTNLRTLKLSKCTRISDIGFSTLKPLGRSLTSLDCSECHSISSISVHMIANNFLRLENVNFAWLDIKDADCIELKKLAYLKSVNFKGCPNLTRKGLDVLWYIDGVFNEFRTPQQRMQ